MKNLTWQNPEQLFVAQELINKVKSKCCGIKVELKYGADRLGKRQDPAMQKFRENRLGAFIHWGLYAIPGGEWNNKTYHGAAEWLKAWAKVPTTDWLELMKQ